MAATANDWLTDPAKKAKIRGVGSGRAGRGDSPATGAEKTGEIHDLAGSTVIWLPVTCGGKADADLARMTWSVYVTGPGPRPDNSVSSYYEVRTSTRNFSIVPSSSSDCWLSAPAASSTCSEAVLVLSAALVTEPMFFETLSVPLAAS